MVLLIKDLELAVVVKVDALSSEFLIGRRVNVPSVHKVLTLIIKMRV